MKRIGIIGTGIWGTALALTAARAGNDVLCWAREQEVVDSVNQKHVNKMFLPDIPLPDAIRASADIADVFAFAKVILLTTSAQWTRLMLKQMKSYVKEDTVIVLCAKGIEVETGKMLSEVLQEEIPYATVAILSGPGFAVDVAKQKLASVTIACAKEGIASELAIIVRKVPPKALDSRTISLKPRVISAARAPSPSLAPSTTPEAMAMTFLTLPPICGEIISAVRYGRK